MNIKMTKIIVQIENEWYDLTEFADIHPGGQDILQEYNEKDATDFFKMIHGENDAIITHLKNFRIVKDDKE